MPCSRLFSLGANFSKFHEWTCYSGKFILDCCMKFDCGSLFSIAEIGMDANMSRCPIND